MEKKSPAVKRALRRGANVNAISLDKLGAVAAIRPLHSSLSSYPQSLSVGDTTNPDGQATATSLRLTAFTSDIFQVS
jgi:hypothetical protein